MFNEIVLYSGRVQQKSCIIISNDPTHIDSKEAGESILMIMKTFYGKVSISKIIAHED